ncbi:MAG: crotonase/enoyl-CoA hydratase family protein [Erythrobacter sp.]
MTDYTQILVDKTDGVATITLNRPEKMNAYTRTMGAEIMAAMDDIDADDTVRAVIFTGAGDRAYCAGADLTPESGGQIFSDGAEVESLSDERVRDGGGRLTLRLFESKKPLISACNGVAVGVGATMQLAMDIRLAVTHARYGFVFARRGIVPEAASSWFLPRIVGISQALEWCYSGRVFDAEEAKGGGLVRSIHAPEDLLHAAQGIAGEIADNTSAISVSMTRAMMWRMMNADHPMEAHKIDSRAIYRLSRGTDAKEGIASFLEKRSPVYPGRVSEDMPDFYPWWSDREYE